MNIRFLNILGLFSCWCFLIGNIIFDLLEARQSHLYIEQPIEIKDYSSWYFIPQSIMIFSLIFICKEAARKEVRIIKSQWLFFYFLAVVDMAKNILLNPIQFALNDYVVLIICAAITIYKHKKNEKTF